MKESDNADVCKWREDFQLAVHFLIVFVLSSGGSYAPPPGASTVMGLECVGEVAEIGSAATKFQVGQRVMALLIGGGYAQYTTVDEGSAMEIPDHLSYQHAAAIPEVFLTAYLISRQLGGLAKDDVVLIHAGASGVGTALIQLCKLFGAHAIVTVGSESKAEFCKKLGAEHAINYKTEANFSASVKEFCSTLSPKRDGASLLLDPVGATHVKENLESLGQDARWILYGTMGGANVDNFPIGQILRKRIRLEGSTLRARSLAFKANLIENFRRECLDQFDPSKGSLKPIIEATFPLTHMRQAHELMESNSTVGKIVITVEH